MGELGKLGKVLGPRVHAKSKSRTVTIDVANELKQLKLVRLNSE
jgi:ribosomal protein L1